MTFKQKDIILISFPFSNQNGTKVRPGLIISNNEFNQSSDDCLIVPLTSVLKNVKYSLTIEENDLESGKLIKKSRIRIDKITSIEKSLIKMKIGELNQKTFENIKKELDSLF